MRANPGRRFGPRAAGAGQDPAFLGVVSVRVNGGKRQFSGPRIVAGGGGGGRKAERGDGRDTTHGTRWPERQQQAQLSGGLPRPVGSPLRWERYPGVLEGSGRAGRPRLGRGGRARCGSSRPERPGRPGPRRPWLRCGSGGAGVARGREAASRRGREAAAGDPSWTREEERADGGRGRASTR